MTKIRIAIQKSGRLNEESLQILKDCGISIDNGKDQLKASSRNFPMEVFYLRNGDPHGFCHLYLLLLYFDQGPWLDNRLVNDICAWRSEALAALSSTSFGWKMLAFLLESLSKVGISYLFGTPLFRWCYFT